jgi:hypothetical protein
VDEAQWTDEDTQTFWEAADDDAMPVWRAVVRTLYLVHGPLTPEYVLEFARPVDSPLHECFSWGGSELDQATAMLVTWGDLFTPAR